MTESTRDLPSIEHGSADAERIGLVAGWGNFPIELAERLRADGKQVYVVAIKGHADAAIEKIATETKWLGVAKLGAMIRYFRHRQISEAALAGKIFKHRIFHQGLGWVGHLPDWTCFRTFASSFISRKKDAKDDTLLLAVVHAFADSGVKICTIEETSQQMLAAPGLLTDGCLSHRQKQDISFGWDIARQMGRLDVGQSITVKDQMVLGVEAIEGTDALIQRTGDLCSRGGFSLVKIAKPKQDMRFDVPTIGLGTVKSVAEAGGNAIVIEAGRTIIVDRDETIALAMRLGVAIASITEDQAHNPLLGSDLGLMSRKAA